MLDRFFGVGGSRRVIAALISAGGSAVLLGGCASQGAYDRLADENRAYRSRNTELSAENERLRAQANLLRQGSGDASAQMSQVMSENDRLMAELQRAQGNIQSLQGQLDSVNFAPLDAATDRALQQLASQYPDLVQYDPERGMLRFASDLTFDSGSAVVKDRAKQTLSRLATILKTADAMGYDVRIVGHTDSQRPSGATLQRHPSNVHLSAHRAISVRQELVSLGVESNRMEVAGWGEYRPAVPNTASGNTPENRRVELFLVASSRSSFSPTGRSMPAGRQGTIDRESVGVGAGDPTK